MRAALLIAVAALAACDRPRGGAPPPEPEPAAAEDAAMSECGVLTRHISQLTGRVGADPDGAPEFCDKYTPEQRVCALAATEMDGVGMCLQIADRAERDAARAVSPAIRAAWPGTVTLTDVLRGADGCALISVVGVLGDGQVVAAFNHHGENLIAWLRPDATDWTCVRTDPDGVCERLTLACRR
jgi:hypothetical protein